MARLSLLHILSIVHLYNTGIGFTDLTALAGDSRRFYRENAQGSNPVLTNTAALTNFTEWDAFGIKQFGFGDGRQSTFQ